MNGREDGAQGNVTRFLRGGNMIQDWWVGLGGRLNNPDCFIMPAEIKSDDTHK